MPAAQSLRVWSVVAMLVATVAGATLRMADLGAADFEPSEVDGINQAEAIRLPGDQAWAPVAGLPVWVTAAALSRGYGEATLRLPAAVAGALTIPAVWGLGLLSFGAEAAVYAAAAMAVAPLHVALSRNLGADAWLTLFVTCTALAFMWAVAAPRDWRRQMVCAAAAVLACGCAYRALLVLAAVAIAVALMAARQPSLRGLAARSGLVLLLLAAGAGMVAVSHPPRWNAGWLRPDFGWPFQLQLLSQLATGQPQRAWAGALLLAAVVVGLVSSARSHSGSLSTTWLIVGVVGVLCGEWWKRAVFRPEDMGFVLPPYLLLGAAGLAWLRRTIFTDAWPGAGVGPAAALALLLAVEGAGLAEPAHRRHPWRAAAQVVASNLRPGDVLVVLAEQPTFAFYAPALAHRMEPDVRPARAADYFVHPKHGWLVLPARLQQAGGWKLMEQWLQRFPAVDLSPDAATVVLYMGQGGREQLLFESAYFPLPTATLVRGTLLLDWLRQLGPVPALLWKVDQIALAREALDFRNPSLLAAVYYLAQHGHGDRAASLAYRLATAESAWDEAQRALAAFQPDR